MTDNHANNLVRNKRIYTAVGCTTFLMMMIGTRVKKERNNKGQITPIVLVPNKAT